MAELDPVETMSTNLETEKYKYGVLMASDVINGKVVDLDVYVLVHKKKPNPIHLTQGVKRLLNWDVDTEEILARRCSLRSGHKIPEDAEEKYKEYNRLFPVEESREAGLDKAKFMR